MIPLGSCTMKLNATTEMEPVTWPEFGAIHPFAPLDQAAGYLSMIGELEAWLAEVTGYAASPSSPTPAPRASSPGCWPSAPTTARDGDRPSATSASSRPRRTAPTPPSAVMAGMRVVVVASRERRRRRPRGPQAKIDEHGDRLSAIMMTYPSTHGVYEEDVARSATWCTTPAARSTSTAPTSTPWSAWPSPAASAADVSHLNLHKTFCIPHGGGGPGVGPVAVRAHLAPFLPNHPLQPVGGPAPEGGGVGPVSARAVGLGGDPADPWAYIRLMGAEGLRLRDPERDPGRANYVAKRRLRARTRCSTPARTAWSPTSASSTCARSPRRPASPVDDVAKRLIDYGFHAPTMSFPVAGTLMVEPTESEDLAELDRFCDAMIAIRAEIDRGRRRGPGPRGQPAAARPAHRARCSPGRGTTATTAPRPCSRPAVDPADKYWPPVRRIDGAYGDRNLVCSCPPPEELADA